MNETIPVIHCCGVFGYLLPWAEWMGMHPRPIYPTRDHEKDFIYLYSYKGQLGNADTEEYVAPKDWPTMRRAVNIDDFILPNKNLDTMRLFIRIQEAWER